MWDLQPIYSICDEFGNLVFDNHWLKPILAGSILIVSDISSVLAESIQGTSILVGG